MTHPWAVAFAAMSIVCCVAPGYRCYLGREGEGCLARTDGVYEALNIVCTNVAQYAILAYMFFQEFYRGPKERAAVAAWVNERTPAEVAQAHGVPIAPGAEVRVDAATGQV